MLLLLLLLQISESNSKYPFYRPDYTSSAIIFNDDPTPNTIPKWKYHNYESYLLELQSIEKLVEKSPWSDIIHITKSKKYKSTKGEPLHLIQIRNPSSAKSRSHKMKMLLISGEHPREMIVVESILHFLHNLTASLSPEADGTPTQKLWDDILGIFDIDIIPMLNPDGKKILEAGKFCWRWTATTVDLNRNFDWNFAGKDGSTHKAGTEEWHGDEVFSEPESKFLRDVVADNVYTIVYDLHSGARQILTAFVDSESRKIRKTRPETKEEVKLAEYVQSHSNGFYINSGISWKHIEYGADGTILDYMAGRAKVPYSFCAEVYGDPSVTNDIDCFVQFNPENTKLLETLDQISTLYFQTFKYFLNGEDGSSSRDRKLKIRMDETSLEIKQIYIGWDAMIFGMVVGPYLVLWWWGHSKHSRARMFR